MVDKVKDEMENNLEFIKPDNILETTNILEVNLVMLHNIKEEIYETNITPTIDDVKHEYGYRDSIINNVTKSKFEERNANLKNYHDCKTCHKEFTSRASLIRHMRIHTGEKPYDCPKCHKKFSQKVHFLAHLKIHELHRIKLTCNICNRKYSDNASLKIHMKIHTSENMFKCHESDKKYTNRVQLETHLKSHAMEQMTVTKSKFEERNANLKKYHDCKTCHKKFTIQTSLIRHMRIHTGEKPYDCPKCHKKFSQKVNFLAHLKIHELHRVKLTCNICNRKYSDKASLKIHMKIHTSENMFKCHESDKKYTNRVQLETHLKSHAMEQMTDEESNKCKICNENIAHGMEHICKKETSKKKESEIISETTLKELNNGKSFKSCGCPVGYLYKGTLVQHNCTHKQSKTISAVHLKNQNKSIERSMYKNTIIEEIDLTETLPTKHISSGKNMDIRVSREEQSIVEIEKIDVLPAKNISSEKSMIISNEDINEELNHIQKNNFKCSECSKEFQTKYSLTIHMKDHNQKTEIYKCAVCSKEFHRHYLRNLHMKVHKKTKKTDPNKYYSKRWKHVCDHCEKAFEAPEGLARHMMRYIGEKPYHCLKCNKWFRHLTSLKRHELQKHQRLTQESKSDISVSSFASIANEERHITIDNMQCINKNINIKEIELTETLPFKNISPQKTGQTNILESLMEGNGQGDTLQDNDQDDTKSITKSVTKSDNTKSNKRCGCPETFFFNGVLLKNNCRHYTGLPGRKPVITSEKQYKCNFCEKMLTTEDALKLHMTIHIEGKPYECSECQERFTHKNILLVHMKTTHPLKRYICTWKNCNKSFKNKNGQKQHMSHHPTKWHHKCPSCVRTFPTEISLGKHIVKWHDPLRETFECHHCGKTYNTKVAIINHFERHRRKATKYKCPHCGKSCKTKAFLNEHLKLHPKTVLAQSNTTSEVLFKCIDCNSTFRSISSLTAHKTFHIKASYKPPTIRNPQKTKIQPNMECKDSPGEMISTNVLGYNIIMLPDNHDEINKTMIYKNTTDTISEENSSDFKGSINTKIKVEEATSPLLNYILEPTICKEEVILPDEII